MEFIRHFFDGHLVSFRPHLMSAIGTARGQSLPPCDTLKPREWNMDKGREGTGLHIGCTCEIFLGISWEFGSWRTHITRSPRPEATRDVHLGRVNGTQTKYSENGLSKMRRLQFIRTMLKGTSKVCLTYIPILLRTQRTSPQWSNWINDFLDLELSMER